MKILFAAPLSGVRISIFIGEYYSALARTAVNFGHQVAVHDTQELIAKSQVGPWLRHLYRPLAGVVERLRLLSFLEGKQQQELLSAVESFSPDVLFLHIINSQSLSSVIKEIRRRGVVVVMWVGPNPQVLSPGAKRVLPELDCVFCYDPLYVPLFHQLGCQRVEIVPLGADVERFDMVQITETTVKKKAAVSFVGIIDDARRQLFQGLHGIDFGIWSWNIDAKDPFLGSFYKGEASGDNAVRVLKSSKISINMHRDFEFSGGNYRLFEIPACGSLQIVDNKPMINQYFEPGKEIVIFNDAQDLRDKVNYFLDHEDHRLEIVEQARARLVRDHGIAERFKRIDHVLGTLK